MIAQIITYWQQTTDPDDGTINNAPYMPHRCAWSDVTAQNAAAIGAGVNAVVLEVRCDAATLAAMEADPDLFVIWSADDGS